VTELSTGFEALFLAGEEAILFSRAPKPCLLPKHFGVASNDWGRMRWAEHVLCMEEEEKNVRNMERIVKERDHK
jgi:hypothetical protein